MNKNLKSIFLKLMARYSNNELFNLECWKEIEAKHSQKSRHYHNLTHVCAMLEQIDLVQDSIKLLDVMLFSVFYHDIIYKSSRRDNEHQSALLFKKRIANTSFLKVDDVVKQIEATKLHQLSACSDTNILLDIDMSILGQDHLTYMQYAKAVRKEYKMYPDFLYNPGRIKVLKSFLETRIFKTPYFYERYEVVARKNINLELEMLSA
ncbi:hypothetical protein SCB49_08248 [unidentified eubacterium SCB49]|nr:hypothetical protein SCB49_08248 [unidentified eubacterium SCB49]